jgi:hypothetical protein
MAEPPERCPSNRWRTRSFWPGCSSHNTLQPNNLPSRPSKASSKPSRAVPGGRIQAVFRPYRRGRPDKSRHYKRVRRWHNMPISAAHEQRGLADCCLVRPVLMSWVRYLRGRPAWACSPKRDMAPVHPPLTEHNIFDAARGGEFRRCDIGHIKKEKQDYRRASRLPCLRIGYPEATGKRIPSSKQGTQPSSPVSHRHWALTLAEAVTPCPYPAASGTCSQEISLSPVRSLVIVKPWERS